jgi:hypothetical protein
MHQKILFFSFFIFSALIILSNLPPASSLTTTVKCSSKPVKIPAGGEENVEIHVSSSTEDNQVDNVLVTVHVDGVTLSDGTLAPPEWWEFKVYPPLENFKVGWKQEEANLFIPYFPSVTENQIPEVYPENIDVYTKVGADLYFPARIVLISVKVSENAVRGNYDIHFTVSLKSIRDEEDGLAVATGTSMLAPLMVLGSSPTSPPPVSNRAPITMIIAVLVIVALTLAWAIGMGKTRFKR